jgi:hypothetical protein
MLVEIAEQLWFVRLFTTGSLFGERELLRGLRGLANYGNVPLKEVSDGQNILATAGCRMTWIGSRTYQ